MGETDIKRLGIYIHKDVYVELGRKFSGVKRKLDSLNVDYSMYISEVIRDKDGKHIVNKEKINKTNTDINITKNILVFMTNSGVEISVHNGIIVYIKCDNGDINSLIVIGENKEISPIEFISNIKIKLSSLYGIPNNRILINEFDTKTNRLVITINSNPKIRMSMLKDAHSTYYINMIRFDNK